MKRSKPLRRTPLNRGKPLSRTGWLRPQSRKRRDEQAVRRELAADWHGERCWLSIPGICTGRAEHWHELVGAGQGGSRVDPRNISASCDACNSHAEAVGDTAYAMGWKVRSYEAKPGDGGLVPRADSPFSLATRRQWGWVA